MDDFLHNLRSGKLKQGDRSNRSYNDPQFKGGARRNSMDRRKGHFDNKESFERLNAIKEILETLAETQKRMASAYQARTRAEERKARAMEVLAKNLYRMLNPDAKDADELFAFEPPTEIEPETEAPKEHTRPQQEELSNEDQLEELDADSDIEDETSEDNSEISTGRLTEVDRNTLQTVIAQLRDEGNGWEKIARHIAAQGYPTVSGKGLWRGIMVKNLFEKLTA